MQDENQHSRLPSVTAGQPGRQCELLGTSPVAYYYQPRDAGCERDLEDLQRILALQQEMPFYG